MRWLIGIVLISVVLILLVSYGESYEITATERQVWAAENDKNNGDITIGVVWEDNQDFFWQGIDLALHQLNSTVLGRKIKLIRITDALDVDEEQSWMHEFANNEKMTAVIGHKTPETAIPASIVYNESKLIYIAPSVTIESLARFGFKFLLLLSPSDKRTADFIIKFCQCFKFERIVILFGTDPLSMQRASLFYAGSIDMGMHTVYGRSFFDKSKYLQEGLLDFAEAEYDAIFISASERLSGRLVKQIRALGIDKPILGTTTMDTREFLHEAGCDAAADGSVINNDCEVDNVFVPAAYNFDNETQANIKFETEFKEKYHAEPDRWAALAYDAMMILIQSIEKTKSTVPIQLSIAMHHLIYPETVSGIQSFAENGSAIGKELFFLKFWHGKKSEFLQVTSENEKVDQFNCIGDFPTI